MKVSVSLESNQFEVKAFGNIVVVTINGVRLEMKIDEAFELSRRILEVLEGMIKGEKR